MLYTIVPLETVFNVYSDTPEQTVEATVFTIEGRSVVCHKDSRGQWRLHRLLSTNPNDYLDPRWQPGIVLDVGPRVPGLH